MKLLSARAICALLVVIAAAALAACGGSDSGGGGDTGGGGGAEPSERPIGPDSLPPPKPAETPEEAIQRYFRARRAGNARDGCVLETERYQTEQYGSAGQACMDDEANKNPQPVWAEEVAIVDVEESGDSAAAVIQPNAGTDAQAQVELVRTDAGWLIDSLR